MMRHFVLTEDVDSCSAYEIAKDLAAYETAMVQYLAADAAADDGRGACEAQWLPSYCYLDLHKRPSDLYRMSRDNRS